MELHLDLIGGLAGDMFVAALLDMRPDLEPSLQDTLRRCPLLEGVSGQVVPYNDGTLAGRRFVVVREAREGHDHVLWRDIRDALISSTLDFEVRKHVLGIFQLLAEAEARVHGIVAEQVTFHEVGAWDSITDIVAAAHIVAALAPARWTVGAVPLGSGRLKTAHGVLPIPAPATAFLLSGFVTINDGVAGERVTPTGAAILRYLCDGTSAMASPRRLALSGVGFGARTMPGISNCVRVLSFDAPSTAKFNSDEVGVVEFEIDDQSGEEIATSLEHIRRHAGVLDVTQAPAFGKKGRMTVQIRVLARPEALQGVILRCFAETTTIGLRHRLEHRSVLRRDNVQTEVDSRGIRVKRAERADGWTTKVESDDVADVAGYGRRLTLRRKAEDAAGGDNK